ncbi:hypothetical protein [Pontibacter roseus]|uniref:hypothetical protein n=1 Tax=Pontibacter roseus TaxID=336989 RepID=UPI000382B4CF|nr:hypothetical protein [Pontibacter roseus]
MERHNWQYREGYRDSRRGDFRDDRNRPDESSYRGAYRLDTDSRHRNETTFDGFDMNDRGTRQQGGDYVLRRSRNLQDNDDYTQNQYQQSYGDSRGQQQWSDQRRSDREGFGSRYGGAAGMEDRRTSFGGSRQDDDRQRFGGGAGNFNNNYGPDRYSNRRGENYGNMAGSLSFGYDGDYNSDPDYNRHYNPLSGEMRSYRDHYTERHPRRYGPPDRTGSNPDYDRY